MNIDHKLLEKLADLEHEQWIAWSKSIIEQCGTEPIKETWGYNLMQKHQRWLELWKPYEDLTEEQKDQDREWARKVLTAIEDFNKNIETTNWKILENDTKQLIELANKVSKSYEHKISSEMVLEIMIALININR